MNGRLTEQQRLHVRAVADKDRDMRELAERFARQDETRAAAEWEIVGAMDDEGLL